MAFRELLFARDEADFLTKQEAWVKEIQRVEIRRGSGEQASYVGLQDYYDKNWVPIRHMWALFERKSLPIGGENTTNRQERAFRDLKADLKLNTRGDVTIEVAVVQTVRWAESKLEEGFAEGQRKEVQIYDADPTILKEFEDAALELNLAGCLAFKKSIDLMRKCGPRLTACDGGVKETFKYKDEKEQSDEDSEDDENRDEEETKVEEKIYETSEDDCSCTRWSQDWFPCRHILFLWREKQLPLFKKGNFDEYYYQERTGDLEEGEAMETAVEDNNNQGEFKENKAEPEGDELEDYASPVLTPQEKYRASTDLTGELRELLCHHGTQQFGFYMYELMVMVRRVRRGHPMLGFRRRMRGEVREEHDKQDEQNEDDILEGEVTAAKQGLQKYRFLRKVSARGRPKLSKCARLQFPKKKKSIKERKKELMKKIKKTKKDKEEIMDITEADDAMNTTETVELDDKAQVCTVPPVPGQIGETTIEVRDFASLAPRQFVHNFVVDFWLRLLDHQYQRLWSQE